MRIGSHALKSFACAAAMLCAFSAHAGRVYINPHFPISGGDTKGRTTLSPPVIDAVDQCSTHVYVQSYIPKATVRIYLNGTTVIGTATPRLGFTAVNLTHALHTNDQLTARQFVNGLKSAASSPPVIVGAMPNPLPPPSVDNHLYECGNVVDVDGLLPGVTVTVTDVTAGNANIGNGFTPNDWGSNWDPTVSSALKINHEITATQASCSAPASAAAMAQMVNPDPSPLLPPQVDPPIVGNDALTLHGLHTGGSIQAFDHASPIGSGYATGADNWMSVSTISSTASISAQQSLCSPSGGSPPQVSVSTISPPVLLGPICPAQSIVKVRNSTIDATLVLLKNGVVVGNGGAAPGDVPLSIAPPSAFAVGDTVAVVEYIGSLISPSSNVVTVNCAAQNVVTQHNNNARQGAQLAERILTPANVSGPTFGLLYERHVAGALLAQPLYVHGVKIKGHTRNVIYVATAEDLIYAFDAGDYSADATVMVPVTGTGSPPPVAPVNVAESTKWLWRTSLGSGQVGGICDETDPQIVGITSTPVIDVSASTLYVVARHQDDRAPGTWHDYLEALDMTTGTVLRSVQVGGTDPINNFAFNDICQRQRPGLLLQKGTVYLGYATYSCDHYCPSDPYRGWIIGYRAADFAPAGIFTNSQSYVDGGMGVWASGNGLAGTDDGSIFYQTGNDTGPSLAPLGDSFVKLMGDGTSLTLASQYQPPDALSYKNGDTDLGSGGPMLLPNGMLVGGGKDGRLFVLSQSNLATSPLSFQAFFNTFHYGPGAYPYNSPAVYSTACPPASVYGVADVGLSCYIDPNDYQNGESFGPNIHTGPVLWQHSPTHALIYKMPEKDYLKSFDYDLASGVVNQTPVNVATVRPGADGMPGGFSSVSANGHRNGIVWTVVQQANSMYGPPTPAILYAHDGSTLKELWNNGNDPAAFAKFTAPTIADGRVVLPSFNLFQVYGLEAKGGKKGRWLHGLPLKAALERKWLNMGGEAGILGAPVDNLMRDGERGIRRDYRSRISGGGYGRVSAPPTAKIEEPMCRPGMAHEPAQPIEASIFASQETGAHYVIGEIRAKFLREGGVQRFGYPITDEVPTPDGFGLMTKFQKGTVYWYRGHSAEIGTPTLPPRRDRPGN